MALPNVVIDRTVHPSRIARATLVDQKNVAIAANRLECREPARVKLYRSTAGPTRKRHHGIRLGVEIKCWHHGNGEFELFAIRVCRVERPHERAATGLDTRVSGPGCYAAFFELEGIGRCRREQQAQQRYC